MTTGPTEHEQAARRTARRCLYTGITIAALTITGILAAWVAIGTDVEASPRTWLLSGLTLLVAIGLSASLISIGATERLYRPQRAMTEQLLTETRENRETLEQIGYAIDRIAAHLPEDQQIHHWRGYNSAVIAGFTEQTGTDGSGHSRAATPRLGLIRNDPPPD